MEARGRNPEPVRYVPLPDKFGGANSLRVQIWIGEVWRDGIVLLIHVGRSKGLAIHQLENIVARRAIDEGNSRVGARIDAAVVIVAETCIQAKIARNGDLILQVERPDERLAPVVENQRVRVEVVVALILTKVVAILPTTGNAISCQALGDL